MHAGEEDHARPGLTTSRRGLSVEESISMSEDRDKWRKYVHGVANSRIRGRLKNKTEQWRILTMRDLLKSKTDGKLSGAGIKNLVLNPSSGHSQDLGSRGPFSLLFPFS